METADEIKKDLNHSPSFQLKTERKLQMKLKFDVRLLFVMSELPNRLTALDFISSIFLYREINEHFLA